MEGERSVRRRGSVELCLPSLSESPQLDEATQEFTFAMRVLLVQKQSPPSVHKQFEPQSFAHEDFTRAEIVSCCAEYRIHDAYRARSKTSPASKSSKSSLGCGFEGQCSSQEGNEKNRFIAHYFKTSQIYGLEINLISAFKITYLNLELARNLWLLK